MTTPLDWHREFAAHDDVRVRCFSWSSGATGSPLPLPAFALWLGTAHITTGAVRLLGSRNVYRISRDRPARFLTTICAFDDSPGLVLIRAYHVINAANLDDTARPAPP